MFTERQQIGKNKSLENDKILENEKKPCPKVTKIL